MFRKYLKVNRHKLGLVLLVAVCAPLLCGQQGCQRESTEGSDLTIYRISGAPQTDLAVVAQNTVGESIFVVADKDSQGDPLKITGCGGLSKSGDLLKVWFGDDGLPTAMVIRRYVLRFSNYDSGTGCVDISMTRPDGTEEVHNDAAIDTAGLMDVLGLASELPVGARAGKSMLELATLDDYLNLASMTLSWSACGISLVGTLGLTSAWACGWAIVDTAAMLTDSDMLGLGPTAVDVVECAGGDLLGCAGAALAGVDYASRAATALLDDEPIPTPPDDVTPPCGFEVSASYSEEVLGEYGAYHCRLHVTVSGACPGSGIMATAGSANAAASADINGNAELTLQLPVHVLCYSATVTIMVDGQTVYQEYADCL
ncbi:MAG: hypothetical protein NTZ09_10295 [Candidatus Hydrogenedentes bacterium]|nr:hypothetical protein [Candidatus Hydrogenedentota bacterium]